MKTQLQLAEAKAWKKLKKNTKYKREKKMESFKRFLDKE